MNQGLLSIIVLTYKHGDWLYETIDSIIGQDYEKIQLIIAEDGDVDFSVQQVQDYLNQNKHKNIVDVKVLRSQINQGTVRNINSAIACATGQYIKIIAGDDTFPNNEVCSKQVEFLANNTQMPVVVGNIVECDGQMNAQCQRGFAPDKVTYLLNGNRQRLLRYFCKKNPAIISTQSICFTREFFIKYGLYDEGYRLIEDLPMAVRMITANVPIGYINWPCVNHRGSVGVSTSNQAFDIRKIAYYSDLLYFYKNSLTPIKSAVGRAFVEMRSQLLRFRIDFSKKRHQGATKTQLTMLCVKNCIPIGYYCVSKLSRVIFYFKH